MPNFHHLRHVIPVCHFSLVLPSVWVPFLCHTLCLAAFLNYLPSVFPVSHVLPLFHNLPYVWHLLLLTSFINFSLFPLPCNVYFLCLTFRFTHLPFIIPFLCLTFNFVPSITHCPLC